MDNPSGASNSDTNQQLSGMSAPIVSTLTTATPVTSEIVSDFEPDPKFEITTLEMASYDCQDIYTTANLKGEHNSEQLSADHANSEEVQDISQQQKDNLIQAEQVVLVSHGDSHDVMESHVSTKHQNPSNFDEVPHNSGNIGLRYPIKQGGQIQQKNAILTTNEDITQPNDCKSGQFVDENIACASSSLSISQIEHNARPDSNVTIHPSKIVSNYDKPREFELDASAELSSGDQAIKNSDNLNAFSLSQTSVDAQMERVIDNIVELGGVHQFSQSFGHPEGREEILASIHREITSERSSIDLIADVASRQKSIEINPMMEHVQHSNSEKTNTDVMDVGISEKGIVDINKQPVSVAQAGIRTNSAEFKTLEKNTDEVLAGKDEDVNDTKLIDQVSTQTELIQDNVNDRLIREEEVIDERLIQEIITDEKVIQEEITEVHISEQDVIEPVVEQNRDEVKEEIEQETKEATDEETTKATNEETTEDTKNDTILRHLDDSRTGQTLNDSSAQGLTDDIGQSIEHLQTRPRSLRPKKPSKRAIVDDTPQENPPKAEPPKKQLKKSRGSTSEAAPMIKLPNFRSRSTISTSDPILKLDDEYETTGPHSLRPRRSLKKAQVDEPPLEDSPKAEPPKEQPKKSRGSTNEAAPIIKLPNFRSRSTISTSDPISRLDKKCETTAPTSVVRVETGKKFKCHQCGYATDRLNNLVYHSTKSFCPGKCQIGEVMKADIIKQQQQAKNKRRSIR